MSSETAFISLVGFFDISVINICANSYVERSASGTLKGSDICKISIEDEKIFGARCEN
jgi:hypothetical protein